MPFMIPTTVTTPGAEGALIKDEIINSINREQEGLLHFLQTFLEARNRSDTTLQAADVIKKYLSKRGIRTVTISKPPHSQPSIASLVTHSEGPCLVMSGLMPISATEEAKISCRLDRSNNTITLDDASDIATKAGTAAMVAAYAYLQSTREYLPGTLVLAIVSDDASGSQGGLQHLLHDDERRELFRSDLVLDSSPTAAGEVTRRAANVSASPRALEEAILRATNQVKDADTQFIRADQPGYCDLWRDLGISTYSCGLDKSRAEHSETVLIDDFVNLVKIHALAAWDYMRAEDVDVT